MTDENRLDGRCGSCAIRVTAEDFDDPLQSALENDIGITILVIHKGRYVSLP